MENCELTQNFWLYETSGDWLTLDEAAIRLCEEFPEKTQRDVLKAGYIVYEGVNAVLPLYGVVREPRMLRVFLHGSLYELPQNLLHEYFLSSGDVFQLSVRAIEGLVLLNSIDSDLIGIVGVVRLFSDEMVDGWDQHINWSTKSRSWSARFDCIMDPQLSLHADDVRVDAHDLRNFMEKAREARKLYGGLSKCHPESAHTPTAEDGSKYPWCAAARKFGEEILRANKRLSIEQVAELVEKRMSNAIANGTAGMADRSGKVPSAATIKRHALGGLKRGQ